MILERAFDEGFSVLERCCDASTEVACRKSCLDFLLRPYAALFDKAEGGPGRNRFVAVEAPAKVAQLRSYGQVHPSISRAEDALSHRSRQ